MEPKDKKSSEWRDWLVRHRLGSLTVTAIKSAKLKELRILEKFIADVRNAKRKEEKSAQKAKAKLF
jgi:hypothetical protein